MCSLGAAVVLMAVSVCASAQTQSGQTNQANKKYATVVRRTTTTGGAGTEEVQNTWSLVQTKKVIKTPDPTTQTSTTKSSSSSSSSSSYSYNTTQKKIAALANRVHKVEVVQGQQAEIQEEQATVIVDHGRRLNADEGDIAQLKQAVFAPTVQATQQPAFNGDMSNMPSGYTQYQNGGTTNVKIKNRGDKTFMGRNWGWFALGVGVGGTTVFCVLHADQGGGRAPAVVINNNNNPGSTTTQTSSSGTTGTGGPAGTPTIGRHRKP